MAFYNIKDGNFGNQGKFYMHEQLNFDTTYLHITKLIGRGLYPPNSDIIMKPDLSKFINLEELTYEVKLEDTPTQYEDLLTIELNKTILDLSKSVKIKRITLINVGQKMIDNLNLNNCIQLTEFVFKNDNYIKCKTIDDLYINKINFTNNINLKNINYTAVVKDDLYNKHIYKKILPDLSNNIHLTSYSFNIHNCINIVIQRCIQRTGEPLPFNIQDHLEFFPRNLTEFSREGIMRLSRFIEEKNRELRIRDDKYEKEYLRLEKKIEQLNISLRIKEEESESFKLLTDKYFCKLEERFNKLEEENRELRKIIDELRPTKSSYM
jgi:hypothetical protein